MTYFHGNFLRRLEGLTEMLELIEFFTPEHTHHWDHFTHQSSLRL